MVTMRSPTGQVRDIRPAGVAALTRLGWTLEGAAEPGPTPAPEKKPAPAKKTTAKRARRKPAAGGGHG